MKITSYIENYYNKQTNSVRSRRTYIAHFKDFFAYGHTAREAIARVFFSIALSKII